MICNKKALFQRIIIGFFTVTTLSLLPANISSKLPFQNQEVYSYKISWKYMTVGYAKSRSIVDKKNGLIKGHTSVTSLAFFKKIYYIGGYFGSHWNYQKRQPYYAYEELYHGKKYEKRSYYYKGNRVTVKRLEKRFDERSYPHTGKVKTIKNETRQILAPGFSDLMGAFYLMRITGHSPKVGEVQKLQVLPAGKKRILILQVLKRERKKLPYLGKRWAFLIKAALADPKKQNKALAEQDIFFKTKEPIYMWVTDDKKFIPAIMYSKVPYLGNIYINLVKYYQH